MKRILLAILSLAVIVSCQENNKTTKNEKYNTAIAVISPKSNSDVFGEVKFFDSLGNIYLEANIEGLSYGEHAIHIHQFGDCSSEDGKSAGGHWNPSNQNHGQWDHHHFHLGDIGNILADSLGKGEISLATKLWCLDCPDSMRNIIGKSIIIHQGADDFISQPSGAAGKRIGCGEIRLVNN
jgi:Cu-Zn family superoxide dismutase